MTKSLLGQSSLTARLRWEGQPLILATNETVKHQSGHFDFETILLTLWMDAIKSIMETKPEETLAHQNGTLDKTGSATLNLPSNVGERVTLIADLASAGGVNGSAAFGPAGHVPAATAPESGSSGAAPKIDQRMESTSRRARFRGMTGWTTRLLRPEWLNGPGRKLFPATDVNSKLASQLKALFSEAKILITAANDPGFPLGLRQAAGETHGACATNEVVAVLCDRGLAVLVITDPKQLARTQSHPALGSGLLTSWSGAWQHWIRTDALEKTEDLTSTPAGPAEGVLLIRSGLIPIARYEPDAQVQLVRQGPIPIVPLAELRWLESTDKDANAASRGPSAPKAAEPEKEPGDTQASAPDPNIDVVEEISRQLGQERILSGISIDDQRLALTLTPAPNPQGEWGSTVSAGRKLIAVECGIGDSGHLAAVIFSDPESSVDFLKRDSKLAKGLRTKSGPAEMLWLSIVGPAPRNLPAGPIAWISNGLVPVAVDGQGKNGFVVQTGPVPVIRFSDIQWAPATKARFERDEIEELFGPFVVAAKPKKFILNDVHFAELLLRELRLHFDPGEETFSRYRILDDSWEELSRPDLCRLITNALVGVSGKFPDHFPPSEIKRQRVEHILWLLEMRAAESLGQREMVEGFFAEALQACAEAKLTSSELFAAYRTYCQARDLTLCTEAFFYREAAKKFGATSHCFGENRTKRGRLGWQLKPEVICNAGTDPDGRDARWPV